MSKKNNNSIHKLVWLRRASQLTFLGLFVYILWSTTYPLKGVVSPEILFRLDPLIMLLTALSERILIPGLIFAFGMILLSIALGRFFCGWVCPLGTVIDGCGMIKTRTDRLNDQQNQRIRVIKFILLSVVVLFALFGLQVAWILDPIVTLARVISFNVIPVMTLAIDKVFIFFIQQFELYGPVYDFYRDLKSSFLGVQVYFFWSSLLTFVMFLVIGSFSFWISRLWCRMLCPLGAMYALTGKIAQLRRKVSGCTQCGQCAKQCRMQAIKEGEDYLSGECILCMDCIYDCPVKGTRFEFTKPILPSHERYQAQQGMSRLTFLQLLFSTLTLAGCQMARPLTNARQSIRPPGVKDDDLFKNTCVRCGNCMKVCITNGLQPSAMESGWLGLWTPRLIPEVGYCEYQCTLCGQVCPTGAIPQLGFAEKRKAKLGVAEIDQRLCYAWGQNKNCLVCEEHCPVADKAIKIKTRMMGQEKILLPVVNPKLCIGCGICQNKCPVTPVRAIRVNAKRR